MLQNRTIVTFLAEEEPSACGYCRTNNSFSQGMWAHRMTCLDYQDLIDRGWRRSGKYCYKPDMSKTCCPQYTIRCPVNSFVMSKEQKKVMKRMTKYLKDGKCPKTNDQKLCSDSASEKEHGLDTVDSAEVKGGPVVEAISLERLPSVDSQELGQVNRNRDLCISSQATDARNLGAKSSFRVPRPGVGADPNKPPCKKAKLLRLERKAAKKGAALAAGDFSTSTVCRSSSPVDTKAVNAPVGELEEFFVTTTPDFAHQLKVNMVRSSPPSQEFSESLEESWNLYKKYQMAVHGDPEDECTKDRFESFLVHSPLIPQAHTGFIGYGSFHQQYWLDGKLICVGVLDILPSCVSSVYLYYDPDYRFLTLGTYSSLREIALTRSLMKVQESLKYYYMGYYIHSCPKMNYKGKERPSFLLCPETYVWVPIESCLPKLEVSKYARLAAPEEEVFDVSHVASPQPASPSALDRVLVFFRQRSMPYLQYRALVSRFLSRTYLEKEQKEVELYASLVGTECSGRMLLHRPSHDSDSDSSDTDSDE